MLVNVVPRSLPEPHPEEKREEPKGLKEFTNVARCGIDPALSLDNRAEVDAELVCCLLSKPVSFEFMDTGRKGLVEGVGREVFGISD